MQNTEHRGQESRKYVPIAMQDPTGGKWAAEAVHGELPIVLCLVKIPERPEHKGHGQGHESDDYQVAVNTAHKYPFQSLASSAQDGQECLDGTTSKFHQNCASVKME